MNERPVIVPAVALGALLALGMALAGWFVAGALYRARAADRYVTVKGLAERDVSADLALWPIVYAVTGNDLGTLQRRLDEDAAKIEAFVLERFDAAELSRSMPRITDRQAQGFVSDRSLERYVAEATVLVRTARLDVLRLAMERSGDLVKQGVALIRSYEYQTQFLFTGLDAIKPEMIATATRDARRAAEQFAEDSGAQVGSIRNAQQGYFSIEDRDPYSPEAKRVRVVTTVQFFLAGDER